MSRRASAAKPAMDASTRMGLTYQKPSLQMRWCLDCHRNPEKYLRPRDQITTMGYEPKEPQAELGARLVKEYHVQKLETCWTCHR